MRTIVQKFGGTSLADAAAIGRCADRVAAARRSDLGVVVVVSAMGGQTDALIDLARAIAPGGSAREMDLLLATGEQASAALMSMAIERRGIPAIGLTGPQLGILTSPVHGNAAIRAIDVARLARELDDGRVVVVAGFQGVNEDGDVTTLGRGGSDITAVAITAALARAGCAESCEIYTDVDGVYTADPGLVPGARRIERIEYEHMLELASSGASIVHPRAVELAWRHGIGVDVRHSGGSGAGTSITAAREALESPIVIGCALTHDVARVRVIGRFAAAPVAAALMHRLAEAELPFDEIRHHARPAGDEIVIITASSDVPALREELASIESLRAATLASEAGCARVSIVGAGFRSSPGVGARLFERLAREGIDLHRSLVTNRRIACCVAPADGVRCLRAAHDELGLGAPAGVTAATRS